MNDLILHNYASSPFSEKIRLILGHKKLPWKSVLVPPILLVIMASIAAFVLSGIILPLVMLQKAIAV